ncbi:uncharacterized protein C4orf54 homolog [Hippoglossus stenolepis]|uniref:uncharacterized protein C4orf54 homolog n=1 Tax=Hippoglossus stenolepis TaxID=195615 RepID=UPI00159CB6EA|nr:uncharacterized protein C4orf54 homolog [Hippoglossus stenolepis]XP_035022859.1 uncharacterized protein C4orf54 homolog [Hippoglossus stenolepis]
MEAAEETLTYLHDTGLHRKLLPGDTGDKKKTELEDIKGHESNYVDLDMKPECAKTVKVTFTGEGNQLSVIKCDGSKQSTGDERGDPPPETQLPDSDQGSETDARSLQDERDPSDCSEHVRSESDELQYTDLYLNSKTESDDGASAVLSDHSGSDTVEDESHYITTHEIQLTELDHDVDYDLGRGTCWEFEDDNLVYSFVDYASFESDETQEGTLILEGRSQGKPQASLGGAAVSTEQEESDLCASSDESLCNKPQSGDANTGKIHLSIKATSRAVNEPVCVPESHFSFVGPGARAGPLSDRAPYFIPAPGRQHLATKLRRNEYSSGASSSISELDDADKEVRNLTAKSFRSLACPYFDAINLSTSSESSMSEYGLNKWSAYVDWNYGNISRGGERSVIAQKTSSTTVEMNNTVESKSHDKPTTDTKSPQSKMYALNKRTTFQQASSKKIQVKDPVQPKQQGVTLNFRCNVEAPEGTRRPKCSKNPRSTEDRSGCDMQCHLTESPGDTHKRAIFASSLLKNVISKKMQFEKEREMERGDRQIRDRQRSLGRGLQRQTSESGSGLSYNSADDHMEGSRPSSCGSADELRANKAPEESPKASLSHSQSSAFNSLKADEPEPVKEAEPTAVSDTQHTTKEGLDTSSMLTKLIFVPSYQLHSKEKGFAEDMSHTPASGTAAGLQNFEKDEIGKGGKPPEIKIRLRTVKENKGCTLNIASLLTPKISYNSVNTFGAAGEAKCHILSATDKMPNFTVRDIRDTKCKFQMPIYRVRDVRKLVKSSYRFVSLDNSESKCSTAAEKLEEKGKTEPVKHLSPSPIVIKCQSVKTNVKSQATEGSQTQTETCEIAQSENAPSHCVTSRGPPIVSKQLHADQSDIQPNAETKLTKQRHVPGETAEWRNEPTIPKQAAIEKLKAAVKTMEQLYVFDRNEWKRKTQAPQPITDSHVRSLIAREEQGGEQLEATSTDRIPQATETGSGAVDVIAVPFNADTFTTQSQQSKIFSNKSVLHFGNGNQARVSISSVRNSIPQSSAPQTSSTMKSSRAPAAPLSVKIGPPKHVQVQQGKVKIIPTNPTVTHGCTDSENYLTIPGMGYTSEIKLSKEGSQAHTGEGNIPEQKRSPLIMEYPAASIYHHSAAPKATGPQPQQQVLCFSPTASSIREAAPQTQRKMLLDPTTGHYYMVDTPIQATTKRLFDPETGQYVDVPMTHSPASPVTPVPLSLSPLTLGPGAFAPTYMIYPSFIPSPTLQAQAVPPQSPCQSEDAGGYKMKNARSPRLETNTTGAESVYYSATGEAPQGPLKLPVSLGHVTSRGGGASSDRKPVISITTQQGPRIIAPPSFDGTTMSFVVEHR